MGGWGGAAGLVSHLGPEPAPTPPFVTALYQVWCGREEGWEGRGALWNGFRRSSAGHHVRWGVGEEGMGGTGRAAGWAGHQKFPSAAMGRIESPPLKVAG